MNSCVGSRKNGAWDTRNTLHRSLYGHCYSHHHQRHHHHLHHNHDHLSPTPPLSPSSSSLLSLSSSYQHHQELCQSQLFSKYPRQAWEEEALHSSVRLTSRGPAASLSPCLACELALLPSTEGASLAASRLSPLRKTIVLLNHSPTFLACSAFQSPPHICIPQTY